MSNEHIKVILGQEELQKLSQEIACLQDLAMSLQAVGLQVASDKVLKSCWKISNVLAENSWDIESTEFTAPSMTEDEAKALKQKIVEILYAELDVAEYEPGYSSIEGRQEAADRIIAEIIAPDSSTDQTVHLRSGAC